MYGYYTTLSTLATALTSTYCFDDVACQTKADRDFLIAVGAIFAASVSGLAFFFFGNRPSPIKSFQDPATGAIFEKPDSETEPERDRNGELVFKAISYTPWPVDQTLPGDRLRINVGPVTNVTKRTYVFAKLMEDSDLITVVLDRPLGLILKEDTARTSAPTQKGGGGSTRIVVDDIIPGSNAERLFKAGKLSPEAALACAMPGDVLRGFTCTTFVYEGFAATTLGAGSKPPTRTLTVFGADNQSWGNVMGAMKRGVVADGPVTLILERRRLRGQIMTPS